MNKSILPGPRSGAVLIPSSKSVVHRLLVCAALGADPVLLRFRGISEDIQATADCLSALGASVSALGASPTLRSADRSSSALDLSSLPRDVSLLIRPIRAAPLRYSFRSPAPAAPRSPDCTLNSGACNMQPERSTLPCGESGSTLRFLLPVAGALGCHARFTTRGRLSERPLAPYDRLLSEHGMRIERDGRELLGTGQLQSGVFRLPADISSQYFSGLLMALPLLPGDSLLQAERSPESPGYIRLTERVLSLAGVRITRESESVWRIPGSQHPQLPAEVRAEGDWSNAAFFLCLGALSETGVTVRGLDPESVQGDRAVLPLLRDFGASVTVSDDAVTVRRGRCLPLSFSAADIPDLVPVLAVLCCAADGPSRITDAARLRYKESDRLHAVSQLILSLGGIAEELPDGLVIHGRGALRGGTADAFNDHRIAMSAAVAASLAAEPVTLTGAECVRKSYPAFWEDFLSLSTEKEAAP